MSRDFEEAQDRRVHENIAEALGISTELLDEHPYQIDENEGDSAGNEGIVYSWRVLWDDTPPEGVTAYGEEGEQWSDVQAAPDDD